ncbi:hypothetical protein DERF_006237 [Dermatophagoides farinae]|uniref:Uncharacterized protein n=1 Tax=Dermatophagoides farinae TaxID=6954 RepID=A0A922L6Z3_DERFA|nr:hypothetical protein DERF_006237 [Dermatophagoides farinae]
MYQNVLLHSHDIYVQYHEEHDQHEHVSDNHHHMSLPLNVEQAEADVHGHRNVSHELHYKQHDESIDLDLMH